MNKLLRKLWTGMARQFYGVKPIRSILIELDKPTRINAPYFGPSPYGILQPPFPFGIDGKYTLLETLAEPKALSVEDLLAGMKGNIVEAKFCKERGIPLHTDKDGFVDIHSSLNWHSYKDPTIWRELEQEFEGTVINNNSYWFCDKKFFDQIVQENPERSSEELYHNLVNLVF